MSIDMPTKQDEHNAGLHEAVAKFDCWLCDLRSEREAHARELDTLRARVAELEGERDRADYSADEMGKILAAAVAERDTLRAELEKALVMVPQDITDELTSLRAEAEHWHKVATEANADVVKVSAEVESLKAQLAEATKERNLRAYRNGVEDGRVAAEEQLRVAREALEDLASDEKVYKGHGDFDEVPTYGAAAAQRARAALSASAPKAEPKPEHTSHEFGRDCARCIADAKEEMARESSVPSQDLPCPACDDVTLMKVAEAVRDAIKSGRICEKPNCKCHDGRKLDLPAIVAEARR